MQAYNDYKTDICNGRRPILVECTDPARSASIESCLFPPNWTEEDAIQEFCTDHEIEESQASATRIDNEQHATFTGKITMTDTKITTEIDGDKWRSFDSQGYLQVAGVRVRYDESDNTLIIGGSWYNYEDFELITADRIEHQNGWYLTRDI